MRCQRPGASTSVAGGEKMSQKGSHSVLIVFKKNSEYVRPRVGAGACGSNNWD